MQARFSGASLKVKFNFNKRLNDELKATGVATFDKKSKSKEWTVKPSIEAIQFLVKYRAEMSNQDTIRLSEHLDRQLAWKKNESYRWALSKALEAPPIPAIRQKIDFEPRPYQWIPAHYSTFCNARFLLADEQRMGKSREAIMVTLHPKFADHPVIIFCPAFVVGTWQRELAKVFGINAYAVDGPMDQLVPGYRYYIASYERMRYIDTLNWFVIIDESHNIKERSTIRGKESKRFGRESEHIILMTGTPIVNKPLELFNQLDIIDPNFLEYDDYTKRFCAPTWTPFGKDVSGSSNLPGLHKLIFSNYVVRRERDWVWPSSVKKTRQTFDLDDIKTTGDIKNQFAENARLKAENPEFLNWLIGILRKHPKVLIFAHHNTMLEALETLLGNLRIRYVKISGGLSGEEKDAEVYRFQSDPNISASILGITAASEGINLSASKTVVFAEPPMTPGRLKQAEDRCVGFEDEAEILVLMPVVSKLERAAYNRILKKASIQEQAIGGVDDEDEEAMMDELAKELGIPRKTNRRPTPKPIRESTIWTPT